MLTGTPWQAQYTLVVGDRVTGRFSGSAVFQTDAIALDSAEISLVEGTVAKVAARVCEWEVHRRRIRGCVCRRGT